MGKCAIITFYCFTVVRSYKDCKWYSKFCLIYRLTLIQLVIGSRAYAIILLNMKTPFEKGDG